LAVSQKKNDKGEVQSNETPEDADAALRSPEAENAGTLFGFF
jgi:hypothetical protein